MKITIEVNGQALRVPDEMIDSASFEIPMDTVETECDCPVRCTAVHRKFTGRGRLILGAELNGHPLWGDA